MLDIKFIRENKELIKAGAKKKHMTFNVDKLLEWDDRRRASLATVERMRTEQNIVTEKIGNSNNESDKARFIEEMQALKIKIKEEEETLKKVMQRLPSLHLVVVVRVKKYLQALAIVMRM